MCWITLTPAKDKKKKRASTSSDCSSAEIVRVHHSSSPRFSDISVKLPSSVASDSHSHSHSHDHLHLHPHLPDHLHPHLPHGLLHHHHRHPHLHLPPLPTPHNHHHHHHHPHHPLHSHPIHCPSPPLAPPTLHPSHPPCPPPREPIYRTQIITPAVRASTRTALRQVRTDKSRGRLKRVGAYDVLGEKVPWDWDCVSSVASGPRSKTGATHRRKGALRYPPFGTFERWM